MRDIINKMIEERARAFEHYKAFVEQVGSESRDMSQEEQAKDERIREDIDKLDARIDELVAAEKRAAAADVRRAEYETVIGGDALRAERVTAKTESDKLRSFLRGETRAFEVNIGGLSVRSQPSGLYEIRDLTVGTTTAGGHTVPTSFRATLYDNLVEASGIRKTNATVITTAGGENFDVPKVTSAGTAAIVGEGTALAEADEAFGKTTLGAWKYGKLLQVSGELLADTGVDLSGYIAKAAGLALGAASGDDFITGSGTNKPYGVGVACGTGVTGGTGIVGVPTAGDIIDLFTSVNSAYADRGFWLVRRATLGTIMKLTDSTTGQFLWQPGLQLGAPNLLLGRPIITDPYVAAVGTGNKSILFGDFSGYFIRDVAGVRFERSDDFAFSTDLVTYRAILRTDGDLVDLTGAVKAFRGGTA